MELLGANQMMGGMQLQGLAHSGYGVALAGFHGRAADLAAKASAVEAALESIDGFSALEQESFVCFLAWKNTEIMVLSHFEKKLAFYRREPHRFFVDLPEFLKSLRAQYVYQALLTGSLGSLQLILHYHSAPSAGAPDA